MLPGFEHASWKSSQSSVLLTLEPARLTEKLIVNRLVVFLDLNPSFQGRSRCSLENVTSSEPPSDIPEFYVAEFSLFSVVADTQNLDLLRLDITAPQPHLISVT